MKIEIPDALVETYRAAEEDGITAGEDVLAQRGAPSEVLMKLMRSTAAREDAMNAIWAVVAEQIGGQEARVTALRAGLERAINQRDGRYVQ